MSATTDRIVGGFVLLGIAAGVVMMVSAGANRSAASDAPVSERPRAEPVVAALPSCTSPALEDAAIKLWMETDGKLSRLRDLAEVEAESSPARVVCRARTVRYGKPQAVEGWVKFSVERHGADQWFIQFSAL